MDIEKGWAFRNALENRKLEEAKSLLKLGADPNFAPDELLRPILYVAIDSSCDEIIPDLLKAGANIFFWRDEESILFRSYRRDNPTTILNILLYYGAGLKLDEWRRIQHSLHFVSSVEAKNRINLLLTAHDIMCERVARCRKACIALWAAPFQQRDLKVWWIRMVVWPTRHEAVWTPDRPMPEGYT